MREHGWTGYRGLWLWLMLGWLASGVDRTITGPVITYMIAHDVELLRDVANPHAVGGLVGSLLFAGYALLQFPGGFVGDKVGHRTVIVLSILLAGIGTVLTGLATGLVVLVAMRVLTGIGSGMFYSNDRSVIAQQTPPDKRSLGMGVVITGLALGITAAYLLAAPLISVGQDLFGAGQGWRMPFVVVGCFAVVVALGMHWFFSRQSGEHRFVSAYPAALRRLGGYWVVFFVLIMVVFVLALRAGLPEWTVALVITGLALGLVALVFSRLGGEIRPVLYDRNLLLIYLAFIPILWNLWFFSFWSVSIVADAAAGSTFVQAALTAVFFGVAGIIGYPAGGWLADRAKRTGRGRKPILVLCTVVQAVLTLAFTVYLVNGGSSLLMLGLLLFTASLAFNALQPQAQALAADLTRPAHLGAMFGMMNLIGEIGAILSPALSGVLRDGTGNWHAAVILDTVLIFVGLGLLVLVRESGRGDRSGQLSQ